MSETKYTYAVARIRAKEASLFTSAVMEQLLSCRDEDACLLFLRERGWGSGRQDETEEEMLSFERTKAWNEGKELAGGEKFLHVLMLPNEFHNLKAAIRQTCTSVQYPHIFFRDGQIRPEELCEIIEKHQFERLPDTMSHAAEEATEALLQTRDGQLCDLILDRAALEAMKKEAKESGSGLVLNYVRMMTAAADIRIAVRSAKTGKSRAFMERAMADSDLISVSGLIQSALSGVDAVRAFLQTEGFGDMADALGISSSAFEKCCDDRIMDTIRPERYHSFSEGPIVAWLLARENEIKTVRIILSGKRNGLPEEAIRERIRKMYV